MSHSTGPCHAICSLEPHADTSPVARPSDATNRQPAPLASRVAHRSRDALPLCRAKKSCEMSRRSYRNGLADGGRPQLGLGPGSLSTLAWSATWQSGSDGVRI